VLVTGLWLLARQLTAARKIAKPGALWLSTVGLLAGLTLYVFGRTFDFISLETLGLFSVAVAMLHSVFGVAALLKNWFPLFYLGFAIPPPGWLIDRITAPLKQFVSEAAMRALSGLGIPVSREGVTIYVSKYQLLMEDACSGMNSLVGLSAISLLYIYLLRGSSVRYSLLMTAFVIPIAIIGNILRVMILILLTYFFGDEVAQGFLHYTAGFLLFALDLMLVFAVDSLLVRIVPRKWRPA
jgi:exosortase